MRSKVGFYNNLFRMRNVKQLKNMMSRTEMIKKAALYPNSLEAIFQERIDLLKGLSPEDL